MKNIIYKSYDSNGNSKHMLIIDTDRASVELYYGALMPLSKPDRKLSDAFLMELFYILRNGDFSVRIFK